MPASIDVYLDTVQHLVGGDHWIGGNVYSFWFRLVTNWMQPLYSLLLPASLLHAAILPAKHNLPYAASRLPATFPHAAAFPPASLPHASALHHQAAVAYSPRPYAAPAADGRLGAAQKRSLKDFRNLGHFAASNLGTNRYRSVGSRVVCPNFDNLP